MGIRTSCLNRRESIHLVNEKRGVTADMAVRPGRLTGTTPQLWLNLQMTLDLWEAANEHHANPFDQVERVSR